MLVRSDRVFTGSKRPLPKGFKPPSAYHRELYRFIPNHNARSEFSYDGVTPYSANTGGGVFRDNNSGPPLAVPASVWSSMQLSALSKIKEQKMSLGVTMAEFPKTIDMVAGTARSIAQSIRYARKGRFEQAARSIGMDPRSLRDKKSWASKWLAIQYGWSPLMGEVDSSCRVLAEGLGDWRYSAVVKRPYPFGRDTPPGYVVEREGERFLKLRLDFMVKNEKAANFSQLGLTNPLEIVWELVPFSFVADWFLPIGDYLTALDIGLWAKFLGGTRTDYYRVRETVKSYTNGTLTNVTRAILGHQYEWVKVERGTISSYLPVPPIPSFDLGLKRMTSGVALLTQLVSRGKR